MLRRTPLLQVTHLAGCVTHPANLIHWWPGDGNTDDIEVGNNGTLEGDAGYARPGQVGQAFRFDGSGDYVSTGTDIASTPEQI